MAENFVFSVLPHGYRFIKETETADKIDISTPSNP
jgi:hypothetical protein